MKQYRKPYRKPVDSLRLIDSQGSQLGIFSYNEALKKAQEQGLDLVEISPKANPPVYKIMDHGKFKYEQTKQQKKNKTKQVKVLLKEIKLHPKTDMNDYSYRLERAKQWISKGYKVKVTIEFKGREMAHQEYGMRWFDQIKKDMQGIAKMDSPNKKEGRRFHIILSPN